jgi:hypothetical protein
LKKSVGGEKGAGKQKATTCEGSRDDVVNSGRTRQGSGRRPSTKEAATTASTPPRCPLWPNRGTECDRNRRPYPEAWRPREASRYLHGTGTRQHVPLRLNEAAPSRGESTTARLQSNDHFFGDVDAARVHPEPLDRNRMIIFFGVT